MLTLSGVDSFYIVSGVIAGTFAARKHMDYSERISCVLGTSVIGLVL